MPVNDQPTRINDYNYGDRVKTIDTGLWGTVISWDGEDGALVDMDEGECMVIFSDNLMHSYDVNFQEALELVKKHIDIHKDYEQAKDLHNAVQTFVNLHRESLNWR